MILKEMKLFVICFVAICCATGITNARKCPQLRKTRILQFTCSSSFNENSRCFFRCLPGYSVTNKANIMRICRCTSSGCRWTAAQTYCMKSPDRQYRAPTTKKPTTKKPSKPKKCTPLGSSTTVRATCTRGSNQGSTCYFSCRKGRLVNPASQRRRCTCSSSRRCYWTGPLASCSAQRSPARPPTRAPTRPPTRAPARSPAARRVSATRRTPTTRRATTRRQPTTKRPRPTPRSTTPAPPAYKMPDTSTENDCPVPDFGRHSYKVVDSWPTGAILRVIINKEHLLVDHGWSALITFTRELPDTLRVMSWTSKVESNKGKYLRVSNQRHNEDLTGIDVFSFTLILLGSSIESMGGYTALVSFYPERVKKAACFATANNGNPAYILPNKPQQPVNGGEYSGGEIKPTTKPARRPAPPATRAPVTRPPVTRRTTTTARTQPPTTTREQPPPPVSSNDDDVRIDNAAVERMKGGCNVLRNGLKIKNPGYASTTDSSLYRFNADIVISGQNNMMDDWTLKVIFSKPMQSIQVWEADLPEQSPDGRVFFFRPKLWNSNLRDEFSFLIIPEMASESTPKVVMFLCPGGIKPSMDWHGIFMQPTPPPAQENNKPQEQQAREKKRQEELRLRQEEIAREQRRQEEERRRIQQLEQERQERERSPNTVNKKPNNENQNHNNQNNNQNGNNQNNRNQNKNNRNTNNHQNNQNGGNSKRPGQTPTVYRRPSSNQPRCSGPSGRLPTSPRQTAVRYRRSPRNERSPYDYNQVLTMSILFYEAQRSGKLPATNRIPWRGDSGLRDGCDVNRDLTGGWYDAGDHVKFGFPMAWSVTTLAWGVIEFEDAYKDSGEYSNVLDSLKWVTDYFIKAHTAKYELYGQVGNGQADHSYWGRAEDMKMRRPSQKIDKNRPGTELAAETAAALAASSVVFRESNPSYADKLVRHAAELYEFADKYRGAYHVAIRDVKDFYKSYSGYNDELVWGALWLYRATGMKSYLQDAKNKYRQFGQGNTPKMFSWDDKRAGSQVLLANFTGEAQYMGHVGNYQRFLSNPGLKTPKGLVWLDKWGSNRYAANAAFICLTAAKIKGMRNRQSLIKFAETQIHYMLGSSGRSFVVGYGKNPPKKPHHRGSSCPRPPSQCSWNAHNSNSPNPYTLYGALVGGPSKTDKYVDNRGDYVSNEIATDYNAGFQGALAGLKYFQIQRR